MLSLTTFPPSLSSLPPLPPLPPVQRLSQILIVVLIVTGLFMFTYHSTNFDLEGFILVSPDL